jgi:hypothetical protein
VSDTRALLALQAHTLFEISQRQRIARTRDPSNAPAPRLYMAGGADGWVGYVREDVNEARAIGIAQLIRQEPPVTGPGATPRFVDQYRNILESAPVTPHNFGPVHRLPRGTQAPVDVKIVREHTPEGDALVERLWRDGTPEALVEAGFTDLSHFWSPWCVAMSDGDIAAIAICVRDGLMAREIGVYTLAPYRGRGLAAAVTAAWSTLHPRHPVLFYSTHRDNRSSQRVIDRLRLPFLGESFRL